ncbi:hypothetical protein [Clostridium colicanis]|uniref:Uncharacterized protein n=1 Tax=Clostridium colicanis DSM 13634 TaxID=1121305 RepID=A0A151AMW4_9CLOT|nr:hypothetical protein [Clostridium colicanis]KYH28953.1 hypothetical protein CLCOL_13930 [Clostridium colicanis DSM 13634]
MDQIKNKDLSMLNKVEKMNIQNDFNKENNKPKTKQVKNKK